VVIAKGLRKPTSDALMTPILQKLRLCVEIDPERHNDPILEQIEQALESNETLQVVQIDDSVELFPLPASLETKLRLNQCGARTLLRSEQAHGPALINAMISQKDHIDTVFHILSNQPSLLLGCGDNTPAIINRVASNALVSKRVPSSRIDSFESVLSACSMLSVDSSVSKKGNYFWPSKQTTMKSTSKSLRKKVRSIFAVSA